MPGVIKINPSVYSDKRDAAAVAWNEALRLFMEDEGFTPKFDVTPAQLEFFKGTAYAGGEEGTDRSAERGGDVLGKLDPLKWGDPAPARVSIRAETVEETKRRTYVKPASLYAKDLPPTTDEIIGVRATGNALVDTVNRAVGAATTFGPAGAAAGKVRIGAWGELPTARGAASGGFGGLARAAGASSGGAGVERETVTARDLADPAAYFRVVAGEAAYRDIVDSGVVRAERPKPPAGASMAERIAARPTAFPSFAKGKPAVEYALGADKHYVIVSKDPSIKPSLIGRHGYGTTHFPTGADGRPARSLPASAVDVYEHLGEGNYTKVFSGIRRPSVDPSRLMADLAAASSAALGGRHPFVRAGEAPKGVDIPLRIDEDGNVVLTRVAASTAAFTKRWAPSSGAQSLVDTSAYARGEGLPVSWYPGWGGASGGAAGGGKKFTGEFHIPAGDLVSMVKAGDATLGNLAWGEGEIVLNPAAAKKYLKRYKVSHPKASAAPGLPEEIRID